MQTVMSLMFFMYWQQPETIISIKQINCSGAEITLPCQLQLHIYRDQQNENLQHRRAEIREPEASGAATPRSAK